MQKEKTIRDEVKQSILFGLLFFIIYFILGGIFSYYTIGNWDTYFGSDSPRVLLDLTYRSDYHSRTIIHPLFVILFQPCVRGINFVIKNEVLSSILLQSFISGLSIMFFYLTLVKLNLNSKIKYPLLFIFALSFANIIFNAVIETFTFAQFFLILIFYYALCKKDTNINNVDITILVLLGIANLGVTITNYFVYLLVLLYLVFFNFKGNFLNKIFLIFIIILLSSTISVTLSELQSVIFPSCKLFFRDNLIEILSGTTKELAFISKFSFNNLINQIKTVFIHGFISPKIEFKNDILFFMDLFKFQKIFIIAILFSLISLAILFIIKNFKKFFEHKYLILLFLSFMFNFILHLFYGNNEAFLYVLHYQFILLLIIGYILEQTINKKETNNKVMHFIKQYGCLIVLMFFLIMEVFFNLIALFKIYDLISSAFGTLKSISLLVYIIPIIFFIILVLLCIIFFKNTCCKKNSRL